MTKQGQRERSWARQLARAERELTANRERIEGTARGVPGRKIPGWRLGRAPSARGKW